MARKKKKQEQHETRLVGVILLLAVVLGVVLIIAAMNQQDADTYKQESAAVRTVLTEDPGVKGRSCGILSELEAKDILNVRTLSGMFTNAPAKNRVSGESGNTIHWNDSCRYVDPTNSNIYVELFIDTYETERAAALDYQESIPKAGIIEQVDMEAYDEATYTAGAWFVRDGKVIIKVSANDGRSGDLRDYSKQVFDRLTLQL